MKKIVSVILALSAIITCFTNYSADENESKNVILFESGDFSAVKTENDNTEISYDYISDAMRVSSISDGKYCNKISVDCSKLSVVAENSPVFAMRIKLSRTDISFGKFYWSTESKRNAGGSWFVSSNKINPSYSSTTEWQLLVFDLNEYQSEYLIGKYVEIILALQPELEHCSQADILISGMGFFEDKQAANEYFQKNNGDVGTQSRAVTFKTEENADKISPIEGNTEISFCEDKKAVCVREVNIGELSPSKILINFDGGATAKKYPILALHIKLTNANTRFGLVGVQTSDWLEAREEGKVSSGYASSQNIVPQYEEITSWQWVFFDVSNLSSEYLEGNILSLILALQKESTSSSQKTDIYIDAVGFLENEDEVTNVFGKLTEDIANVFVSKNQDKNIFSTMDSNTELIFNDAFGGVTVSSKTQGIRRNILKIVPDKGIDAADYPVFAMRIKLSDKNIKFGKFYWRTESKRDAANGWYVSSSNVNPSYKQTDEWQMVVFDLRNYNSDYLKGDYLEFFMAFQSETQVCPAADITVASMGVFASATQAQEYFMETFGVSQESDNVFCGDEIKSSGQNLIISNRNKLSAAVYDIVALHISTQNDARKIESISIKTDSAEYQKNNINIEESNGCYKWIYIDFSELLPKGNITSVDIVLNSGTEVDAVAFFRNIKQAEKSIKRRENKLADAVALSEGAIISDNYTTYTRKTLSFALKKAKELLNDYGNVPECALPLNEQENFDSVYEKLVECYGAIIEVAFGDTNCDGDINIIDLVKFKKYFSNIAESTFACDCDNDGDKDINDLILLRKYLLGLVESMGLYDFPVKTEISAKDYAQSITNQNVSTMGKLSSERSMIYPFDSKYAFNHNPHIIFFKDKFIAMWTAGRTNEDDIGQSVHFSVSDDVKNWSVPRPLYQSRKGMYSETIAAAANFYISNNTLYAYYSVLEIKPEYLRNNGTLRPESDTTAEMILWSKNYYVSTTDGINWSEPCEAGACSSTQNVFKASNGREFMFIGASCRYNDTGSPIGWKITGADSQSAYNKGAGLVCEACGYMTDDRILRMLVRTDTGYLFYSESLDNGLSWSELYKTNFVVESSMCNAGRLPDGRYYIIANSEVKGSWDRIPLYIYVSEDGYNFNKRYIIRDETDYKLQQSGIAKGGSYAYPTTLVKDGYMYIIYSKQKEIIEISKFDLAQIG